MDFAECHVKHHTIVVNCTLTATEKAYLNTIINGGMPRRTAAKSTIGKGVEKFSFATMVNSNVMIVIHAPNNAGSLTASQLETMGKKIADKASKNLKRFMKQYR